MEEALSFGETIPDPPGIVKPLCRFMNLHATSRGVIERPRTDLLPATFAGAVGSGPLLGRNPHIVMEELRRDIRAVGPYERVELRMDDELPEEIRIAQRLEHRTP